jgi:serine protease DegQ
MDAQTLSDTLSSAVETASASVVRVEGRCALASGLVWTADGVVVTAWHAIAHSESLTVTTNDGRTARAVLVGKDAGSDVAVLRTELTGLSVPTWNDGKGLKVGHLALPVGRPGRSARAALGMIAAVGDGFRTSSGTRFEKYIEVDGNLPRGFSGGPLVDVHGHVLGLNTAALVRGGTTVPTQTLTRVVQHVLERGHVGPGYLGVSVYPTHLPAAIADTAGTSHAVVVVGVEGNGPAARGGILVGDVIVSVEGNRTEGPADLLYALEGRADAVVVLKILRGGEAKDISVTAVARR